MQTFEVMIAGETPLLMNRFNEVAEVVKPTRAAHSQSKTPREEAERAAYRLPCGDLYFPSAAISRLLREAGASHKQRGTRKSMKYIVPAGVRMTGDTVGLIGADSRPLTTFEVDSRPVTIPATKGKIMRHRPRLDAWIATFAVSINDDVLEATFVHRLLVEGGQRIGIGDFRPERGGPFGVFSVTMWRELQAG